MQNLLKIKSIVTILLTILFAGLAVTGTVNGDDVVKIYLMIVSFYFGTQKRKEE